MIRFLILAIIIGLIYFIFRVVMSVWQAQFCQHCKGEGYWKGTRGDRNFCSACNGTGTSSR